MRSIPQEIFSPAFMSKDGELDSFLHTLLKGNLDKRSRDSVGLAAAKYVSNRIGKYIWEPDSSALDRLGQETVTALRQSGYTFTDPAFTLDELLTIESYIKDKQVRFYRGDSDMRLEGVATIDRKPPNVRFGHYILKDILSCSPVYRLAHDRRLLQIIASYLGAPPTISSVAMWWSFPSSLPPGGMQLFHHDRGDFRSCNLFVYLTDVTEVTGPHSFVAQTHETNILHPLIEERYRDDKEMVTKFWKWMEQHRKSDSEVYEAFPGEAVKVFTGPKGTSFFEDTRGVHKATIPILGPRLAFEFVYTVFPNCDGKISPVPRSGLTFKRAYKEDDGFDPLVKYATRLLYQ